MLMGLLLIGGLFLLLLGWARGQLQQDLGQERLQFLGQAAEAIPEEAEELARLSVTLGTAEQKSQWEQAGRDLLVQNGYGIMGYEQLTSQGEIGWLLGLGGGFAACMAAMAGWWWLQRTRFRREVRILADRLTEAAAGKEDLRFPNAPHTLPELNLLIQQAKILARDLEQKRQALQRDSRELNRYLENIFHQIKTPLTGLSLCQEYLEQTEPEGERKEMIRESGFQIDQIQTFVLQLLRLAQLDAGRVSMQLKRCSARELLSGIRHALAPLLQKFGTEVQWHVPEDQQLVCDAFWVREALTNLIRNGIQHTPPGGQVKVWTESASQWVDFLVQNTGVPIPEAERGQIFKRFYQAPENREEDDPAAERPTSTGHAAAGPVPNAQTGNGLGLSLAWEIASAHGGMLELLPDTGEGNCFRLRIYQIPGKSR